MVFPVPGTPLKRIPLGALTPCSCASLEQASVTCRGKDGGAARKEDVLWSCCALRESWEITDLQLYVPRHFGEGGVRVNSTYYS